jgi:glycyl-tRNA synthetase
METRSQRLEDLALRRGFWWPSGEIYGGLAGFFDYGPLGTSLKQKFEALWRKWFLDEPNFYEIDPTLVMPQQVFVASGHAQHFIDPTARCSRCGTLHRADAIMEEFLHESFEGKTPEELAALIAKYDVRCPACKGKLEQIGVLNMMFPLTVGTGSGAASAYLRPETAQSAYVAFKRAWATMRKPLPFGLAVIGKAFRNEISPRNVLLRMREFTQAELQIFFDPERINIHPNFEKIMDYKLRLFSVADRKSGTLTEISCRDAVARLRLPQMYVWYLAKIQKFYLELLGIFPENFRFRELSEQERAFYNRIHWDVELNMPSIGFKEVGGLHYRGDHDLSGHQRVSKQAMSITIEKNTFVPHVLELSFGVDRNVYSLLDLAYTEELERTVLKLPRLLGPYDAIVCPLLSRDGLPEIAQKIVEELIKTNFKIFYDETGSIGRRYRRADEVGIPAAVTIDHQTQKDGSVTLRDRDSMIQIRVDADQLCSALYRFLHGEALEKLGKVVDR